MGAMWKAIELFLVLLQVGPMFALAVRTQMRASRITQPDGEEHPLQVAFATPETRGVPIEDNFAPNDDRKERHA